MVSKDKGYKEYRREYGCTSACLAVFGTILSFKLHKFFYSRFFGQERYYIPFEYPQRIHLIFNVLTIINIVMSLLPVIFVDVYGIIQYKWGTQFYIIIIETLVLSVSMLVFQIIEFKA